MNKIVVITGGAGTIGKKTVKKFLTQGDIVIVLDKETITVQEIIENKNYLFIETDVTLPEQLNKAKTIIEEKYNHIDHIISMAGKNMKSEIGGMKEITIQDIEESIKLNLTAHIYLTKIFLSLLVKNESRDKTLTMISSINAITDYGLPAYIAGKAGIYGFMNAITREMGNYGVRVNTISLGTVPGDINSIEREEYFESKIHKCVMNKFVEPNDVAETLYALIYSMRKMAGNNIILDMGQSI